MNKKPLFAIVDDVNGKGFSVANLPKNGTIISTQTGDAKMFYNTKHVMGATIIYVYYIHYENISELYSLLAFACQWWQGTKPSMIYMKEKERDHEAGDYLVKLGFKRTRIKNELKPFECTRGVPCNCKMHEYVMYNVK